MTERTPRLHHRHYPGLFWPLLLIGVGLVLLFSNIGLLPPNPWPLLIQLWPVLLIAAGLNLLFGRSGFWGALISAVLGLAVVGGVIALLVFARTNPAVLNLSLINETMPHTQRVLYPLEATRYAELEIDFGGGQGTIMPLDSTVNLLDANLSYYGELVHNITRDGDQAQVQLRNQFFGLGIFQSTLQQWNISLNPDITYRLKLNSGSGGAALDLSSFTVTDLELDSGSGAIALTLPEKNQYTVKLTSGSGAVDIRMPANLPVRVEYASGSGGISALKLNRMSGDEENGVFQSEGYTENGPHALIELSSGSGHVDIH